MPLPSHKKMQQQNVSKDVTKVVDEFDIFVDVVEIVELYIVPIMITQNEFSDGTTADTN